MFQWMAVVEVVVSGFVPRQHSRFSPGDIKTIQHAKFDDHFENTPNFNNTK